MPELENRFAKAVPPSRDIEGYVDPTEPLRLSADRQATKARSATVAKCELRIPKFD